MSQPIDALRNLGPKSRAWLAEIGIEDTDTLARLGAVEAYARLRFRFGKQISRNMLHALAAALAGIDWRMLSPAEKTALDEAVESRLRVPGQSPEIDER